MTSAHRQAHLPWCIVVADVAGPDWPVADGINAKWAPVQYCSLGKRATMLENALQRAARITHAARIMVTAAEVHRPYWQDALRFIQPEHRFISECPGWSALTTAAAVLSIAARAPGALLTILPARCYMADEQPLRAAFLETQFRREIVADGIVTLGMTAADTDIDEDYLVPNRWDGRPTTTVAGIAEQPEDSVIPQLLRLGALVASGIFVAHARILATWLYEYCPTITHLILRYLKDSIAADAEIRIPPMRLQDPIDSASRPFWERPHWAPPQVLRVEPCGWSGLHSQHAIERIVAARSA
jgi:mannose-1-phosphate guanylyltransferase